METPTFYHTAVLLEESLEGLAIRPGGVYVDATLGGGGHTRAILERLGPDGKLIAFDHDRDAWANAPADPRVTLVRENFRHLRPFLRLHGHRAVDGILADLGVSSHQFDTGERGFSTRFDGPMDMRMDHRTERTAADVVRTYPEADLHRLFEEYGEVRNARQLARHIAAGRRGAALQTIAGFKAFVAPVVKGSPPRYWAQVFQALRMEVNEETAALREFLQGAAQSLKPGGRLAVISFHSGEDRLVKTFIRRGAWTADTGEDAPPAPLRAVNPKPIEASEEETGHNPRARSAKLRVAEKVESRETKV